MHIDEFSFEGNQGKVLQLNIWHDYSVQTNHDIRFLYNSHAVTFSSFLFHHTERNHLEKI